MAIFFPCPWIKVPAGPRSGTVTFSDEQCLISDIRMSLSYIDHDTSRDSVLTQLSTPAQTCGFRLEATAGRWIWLISFLFSSPYAFILLRLHLLLAAHFLSCPGRSRVAERRPRGKRMSSRLQAACIVQPLLLRLCFCCLL